MTFTTRIKQLRKQASVKPRDGDGFYWCGVGDVCQLNFGVTFQLSEKIHVNGPNTHPIFNYLKDHSKSALGKEIKWNFTKFLVSRDGRTIKRFAPITEPEAMRQSIEELLTRCSTIVI